MNKASALNTFWSSFGIPAIAENSSYDEQVMEGFGDPDLYITYEIATGNVEASVALTASIWHRSTSSETIEEKQQEIADYIGYGGRTVKVGGGYLWVKLRQPFAQEAESGNNDLRRMLLNIEADFLTAT